MADIWYGWGVRSRKRLVSSIPTIALKAFVRAWFVELFLKQTCCMSLPFSGSLSLFQALFYVKARDLWKWAMLAVWNRISFNWCALSEIHANSIWNILKWDFQFWMNESKILCYCWEVAFSILFLWSDLDQIFFTRGFIAFKDFLW